MPQQQGDPISEFMALPQDRQMDLLKKLPRENQDRLLAQVKQRRQPQTEGQRYMAARRAGQLPKKDVATDLPGALSQTATELGEESQRQFNIAQGASPAPRPLLDRVVASQLAGLTGGGQVLAKIASGLTDWKTAAAFLVSKLSPAATAAFFATQGTKTAYDAIQNGQASPENVQNFLLGLAGVTGSIAGGAESGDTGISPEKIRERLSPSKPVKTLVEKTQEANAKVAGKAAEEQASHAEAVGHEQARAAKSAEIQKQGEELDVRTEKARHDALVEGNKKFNAVNEKLAHLPGDPGAIQDGLHESMSRISGTDVEPPILKSIRERIDSGHITYSDLQGYYSELGRELSKGTLPGDIYSAYDTMQESIGDQMQKIADSQGAGPELKDARAYWRRMKQTFGKSSDTASDRAAKFLGDEAKETIEKQQREYRKRLLGSFDPEIPKLADKIEAARQEMEAIPSKKAGPAPKAPETAKIGRTEVEAAKREAIGKRADWVRTRGQWAATWPIFYVLRDAVRGQGFPLAEATMESGATLAAAHGVARLLENPGVVKFLSKATAKDIAAIPPDLRGSFPGIVEAAQKQGVKISPALNLLFAGAADANTPGNPTDRYSGQAAQ